MSTSASLKHHQLNPQEWESLIDDFQHGGHRRLKWTSHHSILTLFDLSISVLLKRDASPSLKLSLLFFLEENFSLLQEDDADESSSFSFLNKLMEALKFVLQSPSEGVSDKFGTKEQFMVSVTSVLINFCTVSRDCDTEHLKLVEGLVELLLTVINRPNHGLDRQIRGMACECLREIEREYPCVLSEVVGHLWSLCQNERTHVVQSYLLLFGTMIQNIVERKLSTSIMNVSVPLVPFGVPKWMVGDEGGVGAVCGKELSVINIKELRRAMAFLLEWPRVLTPCGMMEFVGILLPVASGLELQASMLKVQFFGLIYSYNPLFFHIVLMMYAHYQDAFDGQEEEIARRLTLISRESRSFLFFRLLSLHWLFGFTSLVSQRSSGSYKQVLKLGLNFYPEVFDPLALKALKLDVLALCLRSEETGTEPYEGLRASAVKVFEQGVLSVSGFKWLPQWSTETAVALRTFHKFSIGSSSHSISGSSGPTTSVESKIFPSLQKMLVDLVLESRGLVPVVVTFMDRLLGCHKHHFLGEHLLQKFDEHLLPKIVVDYKLAYYFPVFDRIAKSEAVPPHKLIELLMKFVIFLDKKHGPDTGLISWSLGSKVLGICRTMMMNHHSSRLFIGLSRLFGFTTLYFPDIEVRDSARIYLRMLICIPGKKLRHLLNLGEQNIGISSSSHSTSFFSSQTPQTTRDVKKSKNIASYIHLERLIPLLVKQSWSLSLPALSEGQSLPVHLVAIRDKEPLAEGRELEESGDVHFPQETERIGLCHEPLRVMDAKIAEILSILRRHFSSIPDFRHMPGLKIYISCTLRFESEPFSRIWGVGSLEGSEDATDSLPAIYATVLKFSSSAPYGSIPSYRISFLLGEPPTNDNLQGVETLDIVPVENGSADKEHSGAEVLVELEPREPMPGLVDVHIEANAENGQIISGQLQGITIGIEDMFVKASVPHDIPENEVPNYYSDLFNALWEACGASSNIGRETFPLKGGKGVAAISGTNSVKLLEVSATYLIQAIERHLLPFVTSVVGELLVDIVKDRGIIKNVVWRYSSDSTAGESSSQRGPLQLKYIENEDETDDHPTIQKNIGCFFVLIFLPPRFHLLFQMEVFAFSTLVRIRTDHWPCLAYVDEYLEALFLS